MIFVDDLGWADLGCQGGRAYRTPHIDRLAAEGMRFTTAYSASAVCSPSRAALLTGRYPSRVGVTDWIRSSLPGTPLLSDAFWETSFDRQWNERLITPMNPYYLPRTELTLPEILRAAGYATGHVGKWHLGPAGWYPEDQGFDINRGGCELGNPVSYFDPYTSGWLHQGIPHLPPRSPGEYLTDREADECAAFITANRERSFFLHYAPYAVHTPIQAKPELVEYYAQQTGAAQPKSAKYAAMVESVDQAVGAIRAALEEQGLLDQTLILFTSDNGGLSSFSDNAPLRGGKGEPWEGGIRVPLIVRYPTRVPAGSISGAAVSTIDILPTLLAFANLPLPHDRVIDGEDLTPLLTANQSLPRDALYWHFPHYREAIGPYGVVRSGRYKLIKWYESGRRELYDLEADPSETRDLSLELSELAQALDFQLQEWLLRSEARLPRVNWLYGPYVAGYTAAAVVACLALWRLSRRRTSVN